MTRSKLADKAQAVLDFWFGPLHDGFPLENRDSLWFGSGSDEQIRAAFADDVQHALGGGYGDWASSPEGSVALVVLLDQFTRNIYRGSAQAFAGDSRALAITLQGLESGTDQTMPWCHRQFFYLPLEHSEELAHHKRHEALLVQMREQAPEQHHGAIDSMLDYAHQHRAIIEHFGRYPHRNRALGRASTEQEVQWLAREGVSFGQ